MDREEAVRNESYDRYSAFTNREGTAYEGDEDETFFMGSNKDRKVKIPRYTGIFTTNRSTNGYIF